MLIFGVMDGRSSTPHELGETEEQLSEKNQGADTRRKVECFNYYQTYLLSFKLFKDLLMCIFPELSNLSLHYF